EGMWEYLKRIPSAGPTKKRDTAKRKRISGAMSESAELRAQSGTPQIDRTPKLFIGGKQARPDSGYSRRILGTDGGLVGEVPDGNRKDMRNAVEAAHAGWKGWGKATGHLRGQILYYIAENLSARSHEFAARLSAMDGRVPHDTSKEVDAAIRRLFTYAAWCDKWDGAVHNVPIRGVALAMNEPIGVVAIGAPETAPLLGFVSVLAPAIATGNAAIIVPSEAYPLAATDFYSVLETSDLPAGVINIVTGEKNALMKTLAEHVDVESVWYFGDKDGVKAVELASASNMKRTWATWTDRDWMNPDDGAGREFLREGTQVKNIWVPYG